VPFFIRITDDEHNTYLDSGNDGYGKKHIRNKRLTTREKKRRERETEREGVGERKREGESWRERERDPEQR
jgi:hypothetical protein